MKLKKAGSAAVWIIVIILIILSLISAIYYFRIFLVTSGIDETQLNNYENAIEKSKDVKSKVDDLNKNLQKQMNFDK